MIRYRQKIIKEISRSVNVKAIDWLHNARGQSNESFTKVLFLKWNILSIIFVTFLTFFFILAKLSNLQVIEGASFRAKSDTNISTSIKVRAPRGVIYDRNDNQLTGNAPVYRLMVNLKDLGNNVKEVALKLSEILDFSSEEFVNMLEEKKSEGMDNVLIEAELTKEQFLYINADIDTLPGVYIEEDVKRVYPSEKYLAHILGFTGEVSKEDLGYSDYQYGDIIGKSGLEAQYEKILRGKDGQRNVVINVSGEIVGEQGVIPSISGASIKTTFDLEVQKKLFELLEVGMKESGATGASAIIGDINNGSILAAVSLPSYDNNLFVGGISIEEYTNLLEDESRPMLNRFLSTAQPPGSTFKTITALAGLDSGKITSTTIFNSTGVFYLGTYPFQEYQKKSYGPINVTQAIAKSSNIFFYETVLKLGIENLQKYADVFGIGEITGIDLPGEVSGVFSNPEYKKLVSDEIWYPGDSLNAAIGQGYTMVTPVQMYKWVSAIGNGGYFITPHFLDKYQNSLGEYVDYETDKIKMDIKSEALSLVKDGMRESVKTGVVYTLRDCKLNVAAKTGTAEFGIKDEKGEYTKQHAWVTGFFPYENPRYAFVFFQEAGGLGSASGKVAKNFIDWFADYEDTF